MLDPVTSFVRGMFTSILIISILCFPATASVPSSVQSVPMPGESATILVYGDSISAAYGMKREQGWVQLLTKRLKTQEPAYDVINASVSGETTGGGVVRLPKTLQIHQPDLVILELGGNDGLRGYPIDKIQRNLDSMINSIRATGADVLLVGMVLPPNYGRRYTKAFEGIFSHIAEKYGLVFVPHFLEGVSTQESLLQADGIHPTPEAQSLLLDDIWPALESILIEQDSADE